jgi:ribulose-phosphate 3-epimerase
MPKAIFIGPSILSADFSRLGEQVAAAAAGGADYFHVDVMDGQFVPPITFGALAVKAIRPYTTLPIDVHFMVQSPERYLQEYAEAGADILTVHVESTTHLHRTLDVIHQLNRRAGAAINPATPLSALEESLFQLDLVNVLSVNPGYSGQTFIEAALPKIARLRRMLDDGQHRAVLEVDGGVSPATVARVAAAGAEWVVAGSAVYNDKGTPAENIAAIRAALQ